MKPKTEKTNILRIDQKRKSPTTWAPHFGMSTTAAVENQLNYDTVNWKKSRGQIRQQINRNERVTGTANGLE